MRVIRAYLDAPLAIGHDVALDEHAAGHLLRVLRLRVGDACVLFNGDGHDYAATITHADKRGGRARVDTREIVDNESPLRITLLQGVARGEKMDLIVQKATELGVHAVLPVWSERSEVRLDGERALKRLQHWRGVVMAACEQCGRARLPTVDAPLALADVLRAALPPTRFLLDPDAADGLAALSDHAPDALVLAIGPEGGWSPRDRAQLVDAGFTGLRLGPRVLRTETAGLAAITALQARWGDLG